MYWEVASGTYAKLTRLQAAAKETVAAPASLITKEWRPTHQARNFEEEEAVLSVCGWVVAIVRPSPDGGASEPTVVSPEGADDVFRTNYCHIGTPGPGHEVLTKECYRRWLKSIRIMGATGSSAAVVCEKAALALP